MSRSLQKTKTLAVQYKFFDKTIAAEDLFSTEQSILNFYIFLLETAPRNKTRHANFWHVIQQIRINNLLLFQF